MWKVLEEKVPNCGVKEAPANERLGRRVEVPSLRPGGRAAAGRAAAGRVTAGRAAASIRAGAGREAITRNRRF